MRYTDSVHTVSISSPRTNRRDVFCLLINNIHRMKKILFLLPLLAGAASAVTLTKVADMSQLVQTATMGSGVSVSTEWTMQDGSAVYNFSNGGFISGGTDAAALNALTTAGSTIVVATWVNPTAIAGIQSFFGFGGQSDGFKFTTNGDGVSVTTKGVYDTGTHRTDDCHLTAGEWTLVALAMPSGYSGTNVPGRLFIGSENGGYFSMSSYGNTNAPSGDNMAYAIGSGNANNAREVFSGMMGGLTIFTSDVAANQVNNADIANAMSRVVPEPATATLSLLALVGLAARRRR